jgi:predicted nucleic acid-binding protein
VGSRTVNAAVADAGPLIHLNDIGCLTLLRIFETLHIPDAVWSETVGQARVSQTDILGLGNVRQHSLPQEDVTQFIQKNGLEDLHTGERECLYLCQQAGVPILLTDDLAVREAAKRLKLTAVGSLGIVVRAYQLGHISLIDAERHIADLYDVSTLFVTRTIVEMVIEQLQRQAKQG